MDINSVKFAAKLSEEREILRYKGAVSFICNNLFF